MKTLLATLLGTLLILVPPASAHDQQGAVFREKLISTALAAMPGHQLTAVTVTLKPGTTVPTHRHEATVFAYVVSGTVESQLNDQPIKRWQAGESWIERPGDSHTLTRNPSPSKNAVLLAIFVADENARLTTSTARSPETH